MALLYIQEYGSISRQGDRKTMPVGQEPAEASQIKDFTSGETDSDAFGVGTHLVRLESDTDCHLKFGSGTQTATTKHMKMKADQPEYFGVFPGHFLAVIAA